MIEVAKEFDKPVRIGVNAGSLDQELLDTLMDENAKAANPKSAGDVWLEVEVGTAEVFRDLLVDEEQKNLKRDRVEPRSCAAGTQGRQGNVRPLHRASHVAG